jgi:hypothetical protein
MRTIVAQSLGSILLASVLFLAAATIAGAGERKLLAVGSNHVAIRGYDAVAYFTDGKAIKGSIEFEYVSDGSSRARPTETCSPPIPTTTCRNMAASARERWYLETCGRRIRKLGLLLMASSTWSRASVSSANGRRISKQTSGRPTRTGPAYSSARRLSSSWTRSGGALISIRDPNLCERLNQYARRAPHLTPCSESFESAPGTNAKFGNLGFCAACWG